MDIRKTMVLSQRKQNSSGTAPFACPAETAVANTSTRRALPLLKEKMHEQKDDKLYLLDLEGGRGAQRYKLRVYLAVLGMETVWVPFFF